MQQRSATHRTERPSANYSLGANKSTFLAEMSRLATPRISPLRKIARRKLRITRVHEAEKRGKNKIIIKKGEKGPLATRACRG